MPDTVRNNEQSTNDATNDSNASWQIVNNDGKPIAGATIRLIAQNQTFRNLIQHKPLHKTTTDADGRFRLPEGKSVANEIADDGTL